jgi:hypothetical protein
MKIVVIGGSGRIGSKVIQNLRERGHDAIAADLKTGVNTITGEGLDSALADAQVVVDLSNSPSFEDAAVLEFFQTSGRNLLKAEVNAGVEHHVALSIVGADRLPDSGYMRAKVAQEKLIEAAGQPYPERNLDECSTESRPRPRRVGRRLQLERGHPAPTVTGDTARRPAAVRRPHWRDHHRGLDQPCRDGLPPRRGAELHHDRRRGSQESPTKP